jgi:diadenosine tetraphosphate (Ap4A) HIT family hydrolase
MYKLLRTRLGRALIGWVFAHASFLVPVRRLRETGTLMAFRNPWPVYAFHVLLVPKKAVASLADLSASDAAFLSDLVRTVQELVAESRLPAYRLVVNGGEYQHIPQLHFHLISDDPGPGSPAPGAGA